MKRYFVAILAAALVALPLTLASANEDGGPISGTVTDVGSDEITVSKVDDQGELKDVTIKVDSDTETPGISSLEELSVGSQVEIEYEKDGGEKVATRIQRTGAGAGTYQPGQS